jgi:tRNA threonylcarbamoyladenosine biosynthesis protein TsaE
MAILDARTFECFSHSEEQTGRIGARLGELAPAGSIIALNGTLGAGKTRFARGFGEGWGSLQALRSPTFTVIQQHRNGAGAVLYHIDLYRVGGSAELAGLGLDEILDDATAITLIEWPERAREALPKRALTVTLTVLSEARRRLVFRAGDDTGWAVLLQLRKAITGV